MVVLIWVSPVLLSCVHDLRLEGGTADDDSSSSSGSLERFRPLRPLAPRLAADILGRSGELWFVSIEL